MWWAGPQMLYTQNYTNYIFQMEKMKSKDIGQSRKEMRFKATCLAFAGGLFSGLLLLLLPLPTCSFMVFWVAAHRAQSLKHPWEKVYPSTSSTVWFFAYSYSYSPTAMLCCKVPAYWCLLLPNPLHTPESPLARLRDPGSTIKHILPCSRRFCLTSPLEGKDDVA